jgi:hypothetical protein
MIAEAAGRQRAAKARQSGGGLEFVPSKHAEAGLKKLARSGGDWSFPDGKQSRATGVFIHRVMEGLVSRLTGGNWHLARPEAITPAAVQAWRRSGRRVVLVESHIPKDGRRPRLDLAELTGFPASAADVEYVSAGQLAAMLDEAW